MDDDDAGGTEDAELTANAAAIPASRRLRINPRQRTVHVTN